MIIDRNSWHYNFVQYSGNWYPNDLCSYVRAVCIGMFNFTAVAFIIGIVATLAIWQIASIIHLNTPVLEPPFIVANTITVIGIIAYGIDRYMDWKHARGIAYYNNDHEFHPVEPKQPNIFMVWLRDKHNKICRTVKYQD